MLKNKTKIIAFLLVLILLTITPFVYADDETSTQSDTMLISEDTETSAENSIVPISDTSESKPVETSNENTTSTTTSQDDSYKKSDVYLTGDNVTIDYIVDGNLFVMANTVTINSQIGGDAFIMAKKIIVDEQGYIFNNLFAIADSVEIKGVVFDTYSLANNFTISGGYIYRDAKLSCKTLNVNGAIGRNAFVNCSEINFNTDGNTKGTIYGDLTYTTPSEIDFEGGLINGNINYKAPKISSEKPVGEIIANYILDLGTFIAFIIIIWLVCLWLAPKFLNSTNIYVGKKTLNVLGTGLLTLIAVPIACIILLILQLTSSISLLTIAIYILALVVAKAIFTIIANNYLCSKLNINKNTGIFGMLIVSSIIVWILCELPYIGGIITFIISVLGLGVLVSAILPKKSEKTKKVKTDSKPEIKKSEKTKKVEKKSTKNDDKKEEK